ncbi:MAG: hypothetical protein HYW15_02935 [Candidatus Giovannonibacteria bacterium]|nr:MAG: hypothetical protein HYW15_02935 [Candidatus Giovannonibacteria bacterium]
MRKVLALSFFLVFLPFLASAESCFDYYKFQSVEIDLHGEKQIYKAGEGAKFIGSLTNKNSHPLVGGSLILRVSKLDPRSMVGNDIIDEWVAKENINLLAGERQFVNIPYQLQSGFPAGTYVLTSYFLTQNKFNISGLSFTDDIYGGYTTFTLEGSGEKSIRFDRTGVKVDGKNYRIFGFLPMVFPDDTQTLKVGVPLKNETGKNLSASVFYSLYAWDAASRENLIKSWSEKVDLGAGASKILPADLDVVGRPVYFLKIKAQAGDKQSEIHIRFVKEGFRPRLNDVGITQFPLASGNKAAIFACYHNTTDGVGGGKLEVGLKTPSGRTITEAKYEGQITGAIDVLAKDVRNSAFDKLTLSAKLYDDKNNLVDAVEILYDCSAFSEPLCLKSKINWYLLSAGILIAAAALYFLLKHFRNKDIQPTP